MKFLSIVPVIPSADIKRDLNWYSEKTGFESFFADSMYAGIYRNSICIHLQWHADTEVDPLLGGSVVRIFVDDVKTLFAEFVKRGTVDADKLRLGTDWHTNEFGFFDLNNNAIYFVEDLK
ncbi:MAG: glyoxalase/bleomycin resistance/extradiol dioxygenase family protein [Calditrichaeota bacterium]|nr:glyoxalase/bleomycin resistance/extradiol dioxygenase family protein [Calditrichota bacterium]